MLLCFRNQELVSCLLNKFLGIFLRISRTIGICYEGGLSPSGCISDTRTPAQKEAMKLLILHLHREFPGIKTILSHRDLPGMQKSLSLLRCHEASASANFIASSIKIQVLPISQAINRLTYREFFVLKVITLLSLPVFQTRI